MLEVGVHHLRSGFAIEGVAPGQSVVVNAAHRIHVGALIKRDTLELLGRHKVDRAEDGVAMGDGLERGLWGKFCEAKINQLQLKTPAG